MLNRALAVMFVHVAFGALLFGLPVSQRTEKQLPPAEAAKAAIRESLKLLEAGQTVAFMQTFIPPRVIQRLTAKATLAEAAAEFERRQLPSLLEALRSVMGAEPTISADGLRAQFPLPKSVGGRTNVTFQKEGQSWFLF